MIITLLRLGLRAGEVAGLTLDDIDWRAGEVVVHGKGSRQDRLPLPADVGRGDRRLSAAGSAESGRREVFLRARAPIGRSAGRGRLDGAPGLPAGGNAEVGAHRLRHTVACEMVRAGVPLPEIGQVLRHHSLQTTANYARVDLDQLRLLARRGRKERAAMSALDAHVQDYLRLRRALGFKLEREGRLLPSSSPTWTPRARAR